MDWRGERECLITTERSHLPDILQMPKQTPLVSSLCKHPVSLPIPLSLGSNEIEHFHFFSKRQVNLRTIAVTKGMLSMKADTIADTHRMRIMATRFWFVGGTSLTHKHVHEFSNLTKNPYVHIPWLSVPAYRQWTRAIRAVWAPLLWQEINTQCIQSELRDELQLKNNKM